MRTLTRLALLLLAVSVAGGCAPRRRPRLLSAPLPPAPEQPGARAAKLPQEALVVEPAPPPTPEPVEPVPPPQPSTILAGIDKDTPPQRAASLRLTDEARKLLESDDLPGALDRLESAVKIDPTNPQGYYWLAQVHYKNKRYDQAIAFADKAAVLFGQRDPAWMSQAYTFKAIVCEQLGRYADARRAYRRAVEAQAGNVAARAGLARLGEGSPSGTP